MKKALIITSLIFSLLGTRLVQAQTPTPTPTCLEQTAVLPTPTQGYLSPAGIVLDYSRNLLYVANFGKQTVEIYHYSQGVVPSYLGPLQGVNFAVGDMALDNQGNLYMVSGYQVLKAALANGGLTALTPTPLVTLSYGINSIYVEPNGGTFYVVEGSSTTYSVMRYDGSGNTYSLTSSIDTGNITGGILVKDNTGPDQNTVYVGGYYSYLILYLTETVSGGTPSFSSPATMGLPSVIAYPNNFKTDLAGNIYVGGAAGNMMLLSPTSPTLWTLQSTLAASYGPAYVGIDQYGDIYGSMRPYNWGMGTDFVAEFRGCGVQPTLTPTPTATFVNPPSSGQCFIYPSPARGDHASVSYDMAEPGTMDMKIWNDAGELAAEITDHKPAGVQVTSFDLSRLAPRVYIYALTLTYDSGRVEKTKPRKFAVIR